MKKEFISDYQKLEMMIGRVTISAHALELHAKLLLTIVSITREANFEVEYEKRKTLGVIFRELKTKISFTEDEIEQLDAALSNRNDFVHKLSDPFLSNIKSGESIRALTSEFASIGFLLQETDKSVMRHLNAAAQSGGVDVNKIQAKARETAKEWQNT